MTSSVICGYSGASWEINSVGQDACQQYAALVGTCQSTFTVGPVTPSSPPYLPSSGNTACSCNVVAYNLAAACGWCQDAIQPSWWATQTQWRGNCTALSATYNPTGLPSTVPTASLTIPPWALSPANTLGDSWSPSLASILASSGSVTTGLGITTGIGFSTGFPTAYGYTSYNPYTYDPYGYYGQVAAAGASAVVIAIGVTLGLWALSGIIVVLVYIMRQKRRKAWYGPTAAFYASGGAGGHPGGGLVAAPLLFHNQPNVPASPQTHAGSLPSQSPAPSGAYGAYQPPPPGPPGAPYTPYQPYNNDPRQSYMPPPDSAAGFSTHSGTATQYSGPATQGGYTEGHGGGYPPNTPGTNPFNTPYPTPGAGGPPQGPPPGAQGTGGYTGHAEVY